jgi:hypothetical protein
VSWVQDVQAVQAVQSPFLVLPRVAGEETGEGLNDLNYLNGSNSDEYGSIVFAPEGSSLDRCLPVSSAHRLEAATRSSSCFISGSASTRLLVPVQMPVWISFGSVTTLDQIFFVFLERKNHKASPVSRVTTSTVLAGSPFHCFTTSNFTR